MLLENKPHPAVVEIAGPASLTVGYSTRVTLGSTLVVGLSDGAPTIDSRSLHLAPVHSGGWSPYGELNRKLMVESDWRPTSARLLELLTNQDPAEYELIDPNAAETAHTILQDLPDQIGPSRFVRIFPTPDGGIRLQASRRGRMAAIEIDPFGAMRSSFVAPGGGGVVRGVVADPLAAVAHLLRVER